MKKITAFMAVLIMICFIALPGKTSETGPAPQPDAKLLDSLTEAEKNWLNEHPVIRVGGPVSFPPFHYYVNNQARGIGPDYAAYIMKQLGVKLEYASAAPWTEVLEKIKTGRLDVIAFTAKASGRDAFMDFSSPYLSFPIVIISRRNGSFISGLEDLNGKKLALTKNVATEEWLRRDGIEIIPYPVEKPVDSLKAVSEGKADAAIENLAAAFYLIQKDGLFNLKVAAPTSWGNYEAFFGVRKDWPALTSIINKTLAKMPVETKAGIRNDWITIHYQFGISPRKIIIGSIVILTPLILFVGFILYYNRRLRAEISARQAAEKERERIITELKEALSNIRQLKGLLPICASCKKIRDDKGYWTQVEEYLMDHSDAEFSHSLCPDCIRSLYPDIAYKIAPLKVEKE